MREFKTYRLLKQDQPDPEKVRKIFDDKGDRWPGMKGWISSRLEGQGRTSA